MTANDDRAAAPGTHATTDEAGWQALPVRARTLLVAGTALGFGLSAAVGVAALLLGTQPALLGWALPLAVVLAAGLGAWRGARRWRHTRWRLDADGFGLRRGRMWQSDTRVPGSRVQHLDIRRGPLERRFGLATLVIHTAGTRNSEVALSGLDAGDAARLRDRLARQAGDDDDDDA